VNVYEALINETVLAKLISLSEDWEKENSSHGYRRNTPEDIIGNRIFLAEERGEVLGYLLGKECTAAQTNSIMEAGTLYFEIEELYVIPERRSTGIGRRLYISAENTLKSEHIQYILLSTATRNYRRILHFYIEEMGMDFWSARLYKRIE